PELLLRGSALASAELWITQSHSGTEMPTDLQRAFIIASREGEQARTAAERAQLARTRRFQKRAAWALTGVAILTILGMIAAAWQTRETAKREAIVLTSSAHKSLAEGYVDRAIRTALLGLPRAGALPWLSPWSDELAV